MFELFDRPASNIDCDRTGIVAPQPALAPCCALGSNGAPRGPGDAVGEALCESRPAEPLRALDLKSGIVGGRLSVSLNSATKKRTIETRAPAAARIGVRADNATDGRGFWEERMQERRVGEITSDGKAGDTSTADGDADVEKDLALVGGIRDVSEVELAHGQRTRERALEARDNPVCDSEAKGNEEDGADHHAYEQHRPPAEAFAKRAVEGRARELPEEV